MKEDSHRASPTPLHGATSMGGHGHQSCVTAVPQEHQQGTVPASGQLCQAPLQEQGTSVPLCWHEG